MWRTLWTRHYWAPTRYTGHRPKRRGAAPWQILDVDLFHELPSTPNSYGPESGGVEKIMKLSFQPYKVFLKRTSYVAVASFLVKIVSEIREENKVKVVDESDFNVYVSNAAMSSSSTYCCPEPWLTRGRGVPDQSPSPSFLTPSLSTIPGQTRASTSQSSTSTTPQEAPEI